MSILSLGFDKIQYLSVNKLQFLIKRFYNFMLFSKTNDT